MNNKTKNRKTEKQKKVVVMFSGGLDSRLCIKIMQEQGFDVLSLFFNITTDLTWAS